MRRSFRESRVLSVGSSGRWAFFVGGLEFGAETVVFGFVEGEVGVLELGLFRTGEFAGDEVGEVG
jgi:hypothetical protein